MASYNWHKDSKTSDGRELHRYLEDGGKIAALATGRYAITDGSRIGPGSLGILPAGVTYELLATGGYVLVVT